MKYNTALLQNAVSIIICHNHPGGMAHPSTEDISATKAIIEVGRMLGIRVLDHFIFTLHDYVSMKEVMPELF